MVPSLGLNMISASHSLLSSRYLRMKLPRYEVKRQNFQSPKNEPEQFEAEPMIHFDDQPDFGGFDNTQSRADMPMYSQIPEGFTQLCM